MNKQQFASIAQPTVGQINALGLLAVNGFVYIDRNISRDDLRQLESFGLCQAATDLDVLFTESVKWQITDKLKAMLEPYTRLIETYREISAEIAQAEKSIYLWGSPFYRLPQPTPVDEARQIGLVDLVNNAKQFREHLMNEIGGGLGSGNTWLRWLHERGRAEEKP